DDVLGSRGFPPPLTSRQKMKHFETILVAVYACNSTLASYLVSDSASEVVISFLKHSTLTNSNSRENDQRHG
ncbi:MAG: hypothetical protein ACKVH1_02635, partial [Alphaproteobacteria bacterium]